MVGKSSNAEKIKREEADLDRLLETLPINPVPWAVLLKLVAPILTRLAVRYALKKLKRSMSEEKVSAITTTISDRIRAIIDKRLEGEGSG